MTDNIIIVFLHTSLTYSLVWLLSRDVDLATWISLYVYGRYIILVLPPASALLSQRPLYHQLVCWLCYCYYYVLMPIAIITFFYLNHIYKRCPLIKLVERGGGIKYLPAEVLLVLWCLCHGQFSMVECARFYFHICFF